MSFNYYCHGMLNDVDANAAGKGIVSEIMCLIIIKWSQHTTIAKSRRIKIKQQTKLDTRRITRKHGEWWDEPAVCD